jgi:MarR family transcriptional regulator, transcriptional regulator for hemolysin
MSTPASTTARTSARQNIVAADPDSASPDPAELDLGWSLGVLFRAYLRHGSAAFDDLPGGPRGYQLLVSVERGEPTTQLALARRLGVDRTVMTYLIDDLVEAGLVERRIVPTDRRARQVRATARGRRLLPELDRRLADVEARVLAGLGPADAERLRRLVRKAATELDRVDHIEDLHDIPREMSARRTRRSR